MLICVEDLSFRYPKQTDPILAINHWAVQSGETVFLHGPSGSGKSTLLNLLAGILVANRAPNRGQIEILGQSLPALGPRQRDRWRARHIGMVFQQFNLIPYLNPIDNVLLAAHFAGTQHPRDQTRELLTALDLPESLHQRPAKQLSIGQQQRVAVARALINRPELLIVDEPTSALDTGNRDGFMSLLMDSVAKQNSGLVFVSHDLSLASQFNRVDALTELNQVGTTS